MHVGQGRSSRTVVAQSGGSRLYRDVRKLVYKLDAFDRALMEQAHMSSRAVKLGKVFAAECAKRGHLRLLQ